MLVKSGLTPTPIRDGFRYTVPLLPSFQVQQFEGVWELRAVPDPVPCLMIEAILCITISRGLGVSYLNGLD